MKKKLLDNGWNGTGNFHFQNTKKKISFSFIISSIQTIDLIFDELHIWSYREVKKKKGKTLDLNIPM